MDTLLPQADSPIDNSSPNSINNSNNEVNLISLKGYFGGQEQSLEDSEAIGFIYEFFSKIGTTEMGQILMAVRNIEARIGPATIDTTRAQAVYRYLKIQSDISFLTEQAKGMERGF